MKVDILLASYQGERFIREQIESILAQSYREFHLIIQDDGSSDETVNIVNEYVKKDSRVHLCFNHGQGVVSNFFSLIEKSSACWIFLADQDDVWREDKLEYMVKKCQEMTMYYGEHSPLILHHEAFRCNEKLMGRKKLIGKKGRVQGLPSFFYYPVLQSASLVFNQALKRRLFPLPPMIEKHDRYIHLIAQLYGIRQFIECPLMKYRLHGYNVEGVSSIIEQIKKFFTFLSVTASWEREMVLYLLATRVIKQERRNDLQHYLRLSDASLSRKERMSSMKKSGIIMPLSKRCAFYIELFFFGSIKKNRELS